MRRGFKSEAERLAERVRATIGLRPDVSPDIFQLADHLRVEVIDAQDLIGMESLQELELLQPGAFSAATFHLPGGRTVAVYNPCNELARTKSDIAHELAHVLLGHEVREVQQIGGHAFFTCNPESRRRKRTGWPAACSCPVSFCSGMRMREAMPRHLRLLPGSVCPWRVSV
ncbi:ImmA/IrrE family metallo-endopeptidase [Streptomyces sp. PmtG]